MTCPFIDPDGNLLTRQAVLAKEAPVFEVDIAMLIEVAGKLHSIQHTGEHLFRVGASQHPTQDLRGTMSPILALTVSVMMLDVVVLPPCQVGLLNLRPVACIGKCVVREPPLD